MGLFLSLYLPRSHKDKKKSVRIPRDRMERTAQRDNGLRLAKYIKGLKRCFTTVLGKEISEHMQSH